MGLSYIELLDGIKMSLFSVSVSAMTYCVADA